MKEKKINYTTKNSLTGMRKLTFFKKHYKFDISSSSSSNRQ